MNSKKSAEDFVQSVVSFSKTRIKNEEDLTRICEIVFEKNLEDEFSKLAFHAKFLSGLVRIIRNGNNSIEGEYFDTISNEYSEAVEKIKGILSEILSNAPKFYRSIFEEKYFELSRRGLDNFVELCSDLNWVKLYLNKEKFEAKARG